MPIEDIETTQSPHLRDQSNMRMFVSEASNSRETISRIVRLNSFDPHTRTNLWSPVTLAISSLDLLLRNHSWEIRPRIQLSPYLIFRLDVWVVASSPCYWRKENIEVNFFRKKFFLHEDKELEDFGEISRYLLLLPPSVFISPRKFAHSPSL